MQANVIVNVLPALAVRAATAVLCIGVGSERHVKYLPIKASIFKPTYSLRVAEDMSEVMDRGSFDLPLAQPSQRAQQQLILVNTGPVAMHFCFSSQPAGVVFQPARATMQPQQQITISVQGHTMSLSKPTGEEVRRHECSMHVGGEEMLFCVKQTCAQPELELDVKELVFRLNLSSATQVDQATTEARLRPLLARVMVRNTGKMTAVCAFVHTSLLATEPQQFQLKPDEQLQVSIQLKLTQLCALPSDLQLLMTTNSIAVCEWQLPCRLRVTGPVLQCRPAGVLDFGEMRPSADPGKQRFQISNRGNTPLTFSILLSSSQLGLADLQLGQVVTVDNKLTLAALPYGQEQAFTLASQAEIGFQLSMRPGQTERMFQADIKVSAMNQWVFTADGLAKLFQHNIKVRHLQSETCKHMCIQCSWYCACLYDQDSVWSVPRSAFSININCKVCSGV